MEVDPLPTDPLDWRIERACAAAYPPRHVVRVGDWAVALSGGGSRRSNSASAIRAGATLDAGTLAAIGAAFAAAGPPAIIRVTDLAPVVGATLDAARFEPPDGATRTSLLALPPALNASSRPSIWRGAASPAGPVAAGGRAALVLADAPDATWLAVRRRLAPTVEDLARVAARTVAPACYARIGEAAIGYAALHDDIAVIEAVGSDPGARRRGYARAIVTALIDWAAQRRVTHVALQVEATNAAARALYERAGFATDLYGYHYRRSMAWRTRG